MKGTIICYGDSNTYGYDPRSFMGERYPYEVRWTGILERESGWKIKNHGVNGRCIPHDPSQFHFVCEQVKEWARESSPVFLWVMLGTNDLLMEPGFTAEDTAFRMKCFLERILKEPALKSGDICLRLITPPCMEYGAWVSEERLYRESRKLNMAYKKTAECLKIDFTGTGEWEIPLVFDGVHFSEEGHRKFAKKMFEENV